jgi:phage terminase Nu1 subunit (DNA packaging protein)
MAVRLASHQFTILGSKKKRISQWQSNTLTIHNDRGFLALKKRARIALGMQWAFSAKLLNMGKEIIPLPSHEQKSGVQNE